ncbi:MAG: DNA gyrase inhibitor YacG [Legionellaceae bacterium]
MSEPISLKPCPTCRKLSPWVKENPWKPFCSERCRLIDLGAWANEEYCISKEITVEDNEI